MPVKLGSKLPAEIEARIEIIPLIDIMFFLLAAFMLVSLSMVNMKTVNINLPTSATAETEQEKNVANLAIDKSGIVFFGKNPVGDLELAQALKNMHQTNAALRVFISGDQDARHGDIVRVLGLVRSIGIQKVAFEINDSNAGTRR